MKAAEPYLTMGNPYQKLSLLKHRTLKAAIWDLQAGDYPVITRAIAVKWILESNTMPSIVCHENIDIACPTLPMVDDRALPLEEGDVVLLLAQTTPKDNGAYVYVGEGLPLMR
jgi:hypothetical protein